jgi:hypothetical protein
MFGFKVKSTFIFNLGGYFPFIWTALKVLLFGESLLPNLVGLGLGHLYIFLKDIMVISHHKDYLATPQFIKNWWYRGSSQRVQAP